MSFHSNAIFWVEVDKIEPNPYQPRRDFNPDALQDLADSIRQYGVLQPLVVTRKEEYSDDGGMRVRYELIAGERRLRAARQAGVMQVPVVIRDEDEGDNVKLELAIIENLQREDLNPIDRARAFARLSEEFGYKHIEIAKKVGRSREYVSNSIRLLALPEHMAQAVVVGKIKEGHARPLLMLSERSEEQETLFKDITIKNLNVRDAERISRRIAVERSRKYDPTLHPEIRQFEEEVSEELGTRVHVHKKRGQDGGRLIISFASQDELGTLMERFRGKLREEGVTMEEVTLEEGRTDEDVAASTRDHRDENDDDDDIFALEHFSV